MGRNRFVQPEVVRLHLADVYKRTLDRIVAEGVLVSAETATAPKKMRQATKAEVESAQARYNIEAADGAWIDVKRELTAGESRKAFSRLVKEMHFNERPTVDPEQLDFAKISEYVVDWSLRDEADRPIPFGPAALANVDTVTFNEISAAVDFHEEQSAAAREALKNEMAGSTKS